MDILFADALDEGAIESLERGGHRCVVEPGLGPDTLPDRIEGFDALVVRSTRVTAETIRAADRLELIVRAGAGTDNIDLVAASRRAIYVCNVPGRNAVAVAELVFGLLLAVDRHIAAGTADLRDGRWNKKGYSSARGIMGSTLAIVGLGEIGLQVADRAAAFGMRVVAESKPGRSATTIDRIEAAGIELRPSLADMLRDADVVSIHVPGGAATVGLVNEEFLALLADGAIIINTSRGDVVEEAALLEALDERGFRAGLDVFADEPGADSGSFESALASHPSVVGTHHVGASTTQAQQAIAHGTVEVIEHFARGDHIHCVNLDDATEHEGVIVVRHADRVGLLAQVLAVLRTWGVNVKQMSNEIFQGHEAAVATINISAEPAEALVTELRGIDDVFAVSLLPAPEGSPPE